MASDNATLQSNGASTAKRGGFGIGNALIVLGILALMAVIVFVVASADRSRALRTDAVTSAASSLAAAPAPPR
jgi:Tfp pilus assembly protein FimT